MRPNIEPQNIEFQKMGSLYEIFSKQTEYIHSTFDVGRSMFDVHLFLFQSDRTLAASRAAHIKQRQNSQRSQRNLILKAFIFE